MHAYGKQWWVTCVDLSRRRTLCTFPHRAMTWHCPYYLNVGAWVGVSRPGLSSLRVQGQFHFAMGTPIGKHYSTWAVFFWRGTKAKTKPRVAWARPKRCTIHTVLEWKSSTFYLCTMYWHVDESTIFAKDIWAVTLCQIHFALSHGRIHIYLNTPCIWF